MGGLTVEDEEYFPNVCPGCYSIDDEPCASWCIDEEMRREREGEGDDAYAGPWTDDEEV